MKTTTQPLNNTVDSKESSRDQKSLNVAASTQEIENQPQTSRQFQALEIDMDTEYDDLNEAELEANNNTKARVPAKSDNMDSDMQGLLSNNSYDEDMDVTENNDAAVTKIPVRRIGNMRVLLPFVFRHTGWGILGPHWFGPLSVFCILILASLFFVIKSWKHVGPLTASTCIIFAFLTIFHLFNVAFRDPGMVLLQQYQKIEHSAESRWCDVCEAFQPRDGVHCPDCDVCIAGFDHHCVWMGTCIGRNNHKQFIRFNLSWIAYLVYAIVWVSLIGPLVSRH